MCFVFFFFARHSIATCYIFYISLIPIHRAVAFVTIIYIKAQSFLQIVIYFLLEARRYLADVMERAKAINNGRKKSLSRGVLPYLPQMSYYLACGKRMSIDITARFQFTGIADCLGKAFFKRHCRDILFSGGGDYHDATISKNRLYIFN